MSLAQMPIVKEMFLSNLGVPLAGGKLYTYVPYTTTPKATYTDSTGVTPNANPVVLDSAGRANIWLDGFYSFSMYDANGVLQWTSDNVGATSTETLVTSDATAGNQTVTLPVAPLILVTKTDATANTVTINPPTGSVFAGGVSPVLTVQNETALFIVNGTTYYKG